MFKLFNKKPSISTTELQQKLQQNLNLIDVRTPEEYRAGHIKKAKNIPLNHISNYQGPTDQVIYVICQSGMRSKRAAKVLQKMGYQVFNVHGGMSQWTGPIKGGH